jgi:hypothetical protein
MDAYRGGPAAWVPASEVTAVQNQGRCRVPTPRRVAGKVATMLFITRVEAFVSKVCCRRLSMLRRSKDHTISSQFLIIPQGSRLLNCTLYGYTPYRKKAQEMRMMFTDICRQNRDLNILPQPRECLQAYWQQNLERLRGILLERHDILSPDGAARSTVVSLVMVIISS